MPETPRATPGTSSDTADHPVPDGPPSRDDSSEGNEPKRSSRGKRKSFLLRLSPELLGELRTWANQEMRSLNGQIEFLLRDALRRRKGSEQTGERDGDEE